MSSGSVVFSKAMWVPRNDREFVQQATRPIPEVLGVAKSDSCSYTAWLEKDHQGIAKMCKDALVPVPVPKTNRDYGYSMLFVAALATGTAACLTFLKSGSYKAVLIAAAIGLIIGWSKVYFAKEEDMRATEIELKARTERNWLKSKQPQIEAKLKEAEGAVEKFTLPDFDNDDKKDIVRTRDQLLLLKSYVESAVGSHR
ncbi:MAG TPA: hypothetical protein VFU89_04700 [Rhabdochlamydiaceae bacterium]|nr:hypothetical protein [Rhabdochlamydiaceae bacterium]